MKASQQLRKPENWPDFESLCKKLWSEIWESPETKKNGRSGQAQQGIDVYGMPLGEKSYYGIQCKGKDDYTKSKLTEKEVNREIKLALDFEPPLKKMYFATTGNKDVKIESYIRKKNVEHLKSGLFEVHLYSWEDIVDLIDENQSTHDWYLKSQNFKTNHACQLTFHDNSTELSISVPFQKKYTDYRQKIVLPNQGLYNALSQHQRLHELVSVKHTSIFDTSVNHSFCKFYFRLHNTGNTPIEEFKIFLEFNGDFQSIDTVTKGGSGLIAPAINYTYDTFIDSVEKSGKIIPETNILVSEDSIGFDDIAIKPLTEPKTINIKWKLVSRDYKQEGELKLNIDIEIKETHKTVLVEDPLKVRIEKGAIEDYITENE